MDFGGSKVVLQHARAETLGLMQTAGRNLKSPSFTGSCKAAGAAHLSDDRKMTSSAEVRVARRVSITPYGIELACIA